MNSSQINFFTVPEDWPEVRNFFLKHSIKLLEFRADNADGALLDDVPYENGRLAIKMGLTHPDFSNDIFFTYKEKLKKYELNTERSAVIEFSTGGFYGSKEKLHRARFYCVNSYYVSSGELVTKDEKFKKWVS